MRTLAGAILMAIGVLVAGTAGLCGGIMLFLGLGSAYGIKWSDAVAVAPWVAAPFVVGCGLFFAGYAIQKTKREG